jgi:hypothetical protein
MNATPYDKAMFVDCILIVGLLKSVVSYVNRNCTLDFAKNEVDGVDAHKHILLILTQKSEREPI